MCLYTNCSLVSRHARQRRRGLGALEQTLKRTPIPFIKKHNVRAAEKNGADLFEIAAPEIRDAVSGQKKLKIFAKCIEKFSSKKIVR